MPDLIAGSQIFGADWPPSEYAADTTTISSISSTSYIPGTPLVQTTFIAATSGRALLGVTLGAGGSAGANRVAFAPEVYLGSDATGTLMLQADVGARGVLTPQSLTSLGWWSRITLLENLTPRAKYFARVVYRVTSGATCSITYRDLTIMAVP